MRDDLPEELKKALATWCERRINEGRTVDEMLDQLRLYSDAATLQVSIPHPFGSELYALVFVHHRLALEGLDRWEQDERNLIDEDDEDENESAQLRIDEHYDELEGASHNLALVGLVTRLHHWIAGFAAKIGKEKARETGLVKNLRFLNEKLGDCPVSISFFEGIVAVRDSIIHADSQAQWVYNETKRSIPAEYAGAGSERVHLVADHLHEAADNSIRLIKWYEDQMKLRETNRD